MKSAGKDITYIYVVEEDEIEKQTRPMPIRLQHNDRSCKSALCTGMWFHRPESEHFLEFQAAKG